VRSYPDRLAVKTVHRSLTYDELNKAANQVAHLLLAQRSHRPEPVGIYLLDQRSDYLTSWDPQSR
jgi:non-ribosomal peptide synthetase component F